MRRNPRPDPRQATRASEHAIHVAVVQLLHSAARPHVAWTHMPAGELRAKGTAGKLKGMGTKAGWPDFIFVKDGQFLGLELKTTAGRPSPAQTIAHDDISAAGGRVAIAYGLDAAMSQLKAWEIIR